MPGNNDLSRKKEMKKKVNRCRLKQSDSAKFQALYDIDLINLINDIVDSMSGLFYVFNQQYKLVRWSREKREISKKA